MPGAVVSESNTTSRPGDLNFWFKGNMTIVLAKYGMQIVIPNLCIGQGDVIGGENWWVGAPTIDCGGNFANTTGTMPITISSTKNPSVQGSGTLTINSINGNTFDLSVAFVPQTLFAIPHATLTDPPSLESQNTPDQVTPTVFGFCTFESIICTIMKGWKLLAKGQTSETAGGLTVEYSQTLGSTYTSSQTTTSTFGLNWKALSLSLSTATTDTVSLSEGVTNSWSAQMTSTDGTYVSYWQEVTYYELWDVEAGQTTVVIDGMNSWFTQPLTTASTNDQTKT